MNRILWVRCAIWALITGLTLCCVAPAVSPYGSVWGRTADNADAPDAAPVAAAQASEVATGDSATNSDAGGNREKGKDLFPYILLELGLLLLLAVIGRWLAHLWKQSEVLGELIIGVVIGNVCYALGVPFFILTMHLSQVQSVVEEVYRTGESIHYVMDKGDLFSASDRGPGGTAESVTKIITGPNGPLYVMMGEGLWIFSNLGVVFLIFLVGLETSVVEMLKVGGRATIVAVVGVIMPFVLAYGGMSLCFPEIPQVTKIFISATLCATSVSITARVFKDLHRSRLPEARVILGAAVIDDVLGLIILAVVVGIVSTGSVNAAEVVKISFWSTLFLGGVLFFGERFVRWVLPWYVRMDSHHARLLFPVVLVCLLSFLASTIELAAIVGAFAAGLILADEQFRIARMRLRARSSMRIRSGTLALIFPGSANPSNADANTDIRSEDEASLVSGVIDPDDEDANSTLESVLGPVERLFAPVFFVLMGLQVNLLAFARWDALGLATVLIVSAIVGKLACGLVAGPGMDRLSVGVGMIPRGEVGLIFAGFGKSLGAVNDAQFSALVLMVIVSTVVTPVALNRTLARKPPPPDITKDNISIAIDV